MGCDIKNCPADGSFLCRHNINFRTEDPLLERFKRIINSQINIENLSQNDYRMSIEVKIQQNIAVHLGTDQFETDIVEAIKKVMRRDWPHLEEGRIGQIFVPKIFLSKYPEVIDFDKFLEKVKAIEEKPEKTQEEKQLIKKMMHIKGERAERKVYNSIKKFYTERNEDVLVVRGLKFMKLTNQSQDEIEDFEKDFLVINLTWRYVMGLEVKSCLSSNTFGSSKKQINGCKELFDEWLGGTFKEENGWVFLGVTCFETIKFKYQPRFCTTGRACAKYVIVGLDEGFEAKFENIAKGKIFLEIEDSILIPFEKI